MQPQISMIEIGGHLDPYFEEGCSLILSDTKLVCREESVQEIGRHWRITKRRANLIPHVDDKIIIEYKSTSRDV